jgi:DnaJ-class molecular chaperone
LGDVENEAKYYEVVRAYDILSDSNKQQMYNIDGEQELKDKNIGNQGKGPDSVFEVR